MQQTGFAAQNKNIVLQFNSEKIKMDMLHNEPKDVIGSVYKANLIQ